MKKKELLNKFCRMVEKKNVKRAACLGLAAALFAVTVNSHAVMAKTEAQKQEEEEETLTELVLQETGTGSADADKEETVYLIGDANGNIKETIVSDWLKNPGNAATLKDASDLNDIVNVKGDETFSKGAGGELTWQAAGSDIYYQGSTGKEAPVRVRVSYYLNNKEVAPQEIAGQSGKVKIRFDYENLKKETIEINDKKEEVNVPFGVVTAMILPIENFTNVKVSNGKVLSEGSRSIVVGLAFPGLEESLNLKQEEIDAQIPDYVEVEADAEDFELQMTLSVVMSDVLGMLDVNDSIDLDNVTDDLDELSDASTQLVDGSSELKDGTKELKNGTSTLAEGANTLNSKTGDLTSGAGQLASGVSEYTTGVDQLAGGIKTLKKGTEKMKKNMPALKSGVDTLKAGSASAKSGADQLVAGYEGEQGAVAGAQSLAAGAKQVSDGMGQLQGSLGTLQAALAAQKQGIAAQTGFGSSADIAAVLGSGAITDAQQIAGLSEAKGALQVIEAVEQGLFNQQAQESLSVLSAGAKQVSDGAASLSGGVNQLYAGTKQLDGGLATLDEGIGSLQKSVGTLADGVKELDSGAGQLVSGAKELTDNSAKLVSGAGSLSSGTVQVANAIGEIAKGASKLDDGAKELDAGADKLSDGMQEFDETGIQKLSTTINIDVKENLDKLKAIVDLGADYQTFTSLAEGQKGTVKFIIKTEAVKAE